MNIPDEAIQAATDAVLFLWGNFPEQDGAHAKILGTVTAKAAAPFIVAAERDRIRQLAVEVGAVYASTMPDGETDENVPFDTLLDGAP
jgi:hypothetical protein